MEEGLQFLLHLALILLFANIGGHLSKRFNQPAVLGQILAGLLLGPSVFKIIHRTEFITSIAEIGVILLMFIAGLETDLEELKCSGKSSFLVALGGVVFPLIFGVFAVMIFSPSANTVQALFVGVILTATSVGITVQVLRELKQLKTKQGMAVLGAAIIDDVVGIILVTLVASTANPEGASDIVFVIGKIIMFFALAVGFGMIFSKMLTRYTDFFVRENRILTAALIFCFLLAFIAEEMGVAAIIGAYLTGVIFSTTSHRNRVSHEIQNIAYSLFTPIFFVNIGLKVELSNIHGSLLISIFIIIAAILGKVLGCGLGAKLSNFSTRQSLQISLGMIPRAEVALIVASLGLKVGIIGEDIFTSIILLVLVSTIITPILLKLAYKNEINSEIA